MEQAPKELTAAVEKLSEQTGRLTEILEKQAGLMRRFLMGLVYGVGTAVGATIVATIVIIALSRILEPLGLDLTDLFPG